MAAGTTSCMEPIYEAEEWAAKHPWRVYLSAAGGSALIGGTTTWFITGVLTTALGFAGISIPMGMFALSACLRLCERRVDSSQEASAFLAAERERGQGGVPAYNTMGNP